MVLKIELVHKSTMYLKLSFIYGLITGYSQVNIYLLTLETYSN